MSQDVKMFYIDDDMKKVQVKTNLYLQQYGPLGVFHLSKEGIQNSLDELEDPKSNGKNINIKYDHKTDMLTIDDDGRGIPETDYPIDIVCTKLQSGSKFFRSQGGKSSGEFGVGITVVNALSSYFKLATYREAENYVHIIEFENGEKIKDTKRPLKKTDKKHGTTMAFSVNPKYLGKDAHLPFDVMLEWIDTMSYQISPKIKITVEEYDGLELLNKYKIKAKPFSQLIEKIVPDMKKLIYEPISFSADGEIEEEIMDTELTKSSKVNVNKKMVKKSIHMDVTIAYDNNSENDYDSYCNFTRTTEGGVHVDSVEEVYCRYIQNKTKASMTDKEKSKWDITWNDIKAGLKMIVNLSTDAQVQFMGNAKNQIQNKALKPILKEIIQKEISEYFDNNQAKLQALCKIVKTNARARVEMQKVKTATTQERLDTFKEYQIDNYIKCNNTGKKYKELHLIEGERSASGSAVNGRYSADTQAFFCFRGVTANPFKCSLSDIMQNKEWRNYIKVIRTNIGDKFDINKLYFDKIIIMTDADVDGFYISAGICGFHAMYLPEIVKAGKLYKVFSPLYRIDDKDNPFVGNKGELSEVFMKKIVKNYDIKLINDEKYMNKNEVYSLLFDTIDYRESLIRLNKYFRIEKYLIELIAALLTISGAVKSTDDFVDMNKLFSDQSFISEFMSRIQEKFPEVTLSGKNSLRGVINGRYISIQVNNRFVKKLDDFIDIYKEYGYLLKVKNKGSDEERIMTIGEFLDDSYKLMPKIITRYKGLGEANPQQIRETTLNPDNRILVQLTMDDAERDLAIFQKLQGKRQKDQIARKRMMEEYKINREDLDN